MKKLPVYLSLALTLAGLASCEKEIEEVATPSAEAGAQQVQQTPQQMLSSGQWRLTDLTTTSQPTGVAEAATVSVFGQLKSTMRDNLTQFTADGRYLQDEGATKVTPNQPQQKAGTFALGEDGKTLTVKMADYERHYTIAELTASKLRLTLTEGEGASAVTYTSTFAH